MKTKSVILTIIFLLIILQNNFSQSHDIRTITERIYVISVLQPESKETCIWNILPDTWDNAQPLVLKPGFDTVNLNSVHPILRFKKENSKPYYISPRTIILQEAINFRDMGGYITRDGRQVKWGKLFRSADISKLTDKDLDVLSGINLKMVCDLRGEQEVGAAPDRIPASAQRILLSAGSENVTPGIGSFVKYLKNEESADSMIMSMYSNTSFLGMKYKPVFDQLLSLENDKSLLIHCTAGKDRTGIGAALILYSLGVEEPVIYNDYEATNIYRKEENEKTVKVLTGFGISENSARRLMSADPKYLKATFDSIKQQYGSVESFLETVMGLSHEKIEVLRSKFLY